KRFLSSAADQDRWQNKGRARLWDARTGRPVTPPLAMDRRGYPDWWKDWKVGDPRVSGALAASLRRGSIPNERVAWSPSGAVLFTWNEGELCRFWDAATGKCIGEPVSEKLADYGLDKLREELSWHNRKFNEGIQAP